MTWVRCECGCGFEGEDDVVQFCVEEAVMERLYWTEKIRPLTGGMAEASGVSPHEQAQAEHEQLMRDLKG